MQPTRSERNISLSYSSTVSIKGKKTKRLKNCNGETASGFASLACRLTIRDMGVNSLWTSSVCLKSPKNISSLSLKAFFVCRGKHQPASSSSS